MLRKCTVEDRQVLDAYLKQEQEYNTFLQADVAAYGFDYPCQDVWMEDVNGICKGIYLRFYTNLLVYSKEKITDCTSIETILKNFPVFVIMGKSSVLEDISEYLEEKYHCTEKQLYRLLTEKDLYPETSDIVRAEEKDVEDIFEFLQKIPQIKALYTSKDMIYDRIVSGDGIHLLIRDGEKIISHGNSTTEADRTAMLGGLATDIMYRRKGYASKVLSALCRYVLNRGKIPCLFSDGELQPFLEKIGFECMGGWSTLERN